MDAYLSSTDFRPFWIAWNDTTLKVGKGEIVGEERITSYTWENSKDIRAIFIGGRGYDSFDFKMGK